MKAYQMFLAIGILLAAGVPDTSWGQPPSYTFEVIDIPSTTHPNRLIQFRGVMNSELLLGDDPGPGGIASRITRNPLVITAIACPNDASFTRNPLAGRGGPSVGGISLKGGVVVGDDEGLNPQVGVALFGFAQQSNGACAFYRVPGSIGTTFADINDLGQIVGFSWTADTSLGLRRMQGFVLDGTTVTPLTGPGPNDVVLPSAMNENGTIIGQVLENVTPPPENAYTPRTFVYSAGVYRFVQLPDGSLSGLNALNNNGQAVGTGGPGGHTMVLYDANTDTFQTLPNPPASPGFLIQAVAPRGINDSGQITGMFEEVEDTPNVLTARTAFHGFLATPVGPSKPGRRTEHGKPWKVHRHAVRERWGTDNEAHQMGRTKQWRPVQTPDGGVGLADGDELIVGGQ